MEFHFFLRYTYSINLYSKLYEEFVSKMNPSVKKRCPYMEKCYRKNPIHFNEMSHPHLEKLVMNQLEGPIQIPAKLDFECADTSQLLDQLKVLQMVLRKERDKTGSGLLSSTKNNVPKNKIDSPSTSANDRRTNERRTDDDLKSKVERHKQATAQKRENKLREMDIEAAALLKPSTSSDSTESESIGVSKMQQELDNLKIMEEAQETPDFKGKKRYHSSVDATPSSTKKSRSESESVSDLSEQSDESSGSREGASSLKGTSIMDMYKTCNTPSKRESVRRKAIEMMKRQGFKLSLVEPGEFAYKYALSAPYHIFFSRIQNSKQTYDQQFSITFPEILDKSLGEIVSSLQINFMVDVGWLCLQYLLAGQCTDMMILYGERVDEEKVGLNITMIHIGMPTKFGCHHSKIMILKYKDDGIRVVVSTANLYSDDWENRTQGLWISPHLPPLPASANPSEGESPTGFKKDLERYLSRYRQPALTEWICAVRRADFSSVNVFFIASVPGSYKDAERDLWGHQKLAQILSKHATLPSDAPQWPIVAQSSSIGSMGRNFESWLLKDIVSSMTLESTRGLKSHPKFLFVYPTINNYKQGFDCRTGSCCLPYGIQVHSKQTWLESYMYQWKASRTGRDKAMPHIKSYTRISPDLKKIPWFVLTSANLSKSAWGTQAASLTIRNYEAGVVFIPKFMVGDTTFPIQAGTPGTPVFPIMYDIPLTRYEAEDKPFVIEFFQGYE